MDSISLSELNNLIKQTLKAEFAKPLWVKAEISELHENANGHCYLELIENDKTTDQILSRQKATIWSFTYRMLKPYFESAAMTSLQVGMNVLLQVQIEFHEVYGIGLNVKDIDPTYTVGEMARRRAEIIKQLADEGVIDLNKQLELSPTPQRIAVISSATAAGFGDFNNQLSDNKFGYKFYIKLFPAIMQGSQTEQSVIAALDKINEFIDMFDVVVIIRGGGSTTDLAAFDNYHIALNCTQFPLPIISGIGHERDDTIVDIVAHTRVKTPTAAAEFLIDQLNETETYVMSLTENMTYIAREIINNERQHFQHLLLNFPQSAKNKIATENTLLNDLVHTTKLGIHQLLNKENNKLSIVETKLNYASPEQILKKGYSMTLKNGKLVKSVKEIKKGDTIETVLTDGEIISTAK